MHTTNTKVRGSLSCCPHAPRHGLSSTHSPDPYFIAPPPIFCNRHHRNTFELAAHPCSLRPPSLPYFLLSRLHRLRHLQEGALCARPQTQRGLERLVHTRRAACRAERPSLLRMAKSPARSRAVGHVLPALTAPRLPRSAARLRAHGAADDIRCGVLAGSAAHREHRRRAALCEPRDGAVREGDHAATV